MQEQKSRKWMGWSLLAVAEAVAVGLIAMYQGMAMGNPLSENARYLSDGCFVVGLMMTGVGLLTWVSTTGFFDIMGYGIQYGVRAVIGLFGGNRKPNNQNFYDYKMAKDEKRGKPAYIILFSGIALILLSIMFLVIYYNV